MKRLITNFICLSSAIFLGAVAAPPLVSHAEESSYFTGETFFFEEPVNGAGEALNNLPQSMAGEGTEDITSEDTGTTEQPEDTAEVPDGTLNITEGQENTDRTVQVIDEREWDEEDGVKGEAIAEFSEFDDEGDWILTIKDTEGEAIRARIDEEKINYSGIKTYEISMVNRDTGENISTDFGTCDILLPVEKASVDFETTDVSMIGFSSDGTLKPVIKTLGLTGTDGSKYILFTTDHFSEYALLFSQKNNTADTEPVPEPEPQPEPEPEPEIEIQPIAIQEPGAGGETAKEPAKDTEKSRSRERTRNARNNDNRNEDVVADLVIENTEAINEDTEVTEISTENTEITEEAEITEDAETTDGDLDVIAEEVEDVAMLNQGTSPIKSSVADNSALAANKSLFSYIFPIMMTLIILVMFFSILKNLEKMEEEEKKERQGR